MRDMTKPFQILVNGYDIQLLQTVKDTIHSLEVYHLPGLRITLDPKMSKPIAEWLYNLTQKVKGLIEYNGILMYKEDINKPIHMK